MTAILAGAFPDAFLLGVAYPRPGPLAANELPHLLNQYTCAAVRSPTLLDYLQDVQRRQRVAVAIRALVCGGGARAQTFQALVSSPTFAARMAATHEHPD